MSRTLVIDNYDSFTYNLVHYLEAAGEREVKVVRNDEIRPESITAFDRLVLSPGPGLPSTSGKLLPIIRQYASIKPMLGVCLGMQAMAEVFDGKLRQLREVYHGEASTMEIFDRKGLFKSMPSRFEAGRYHSWVVDKDKLPSGFMITVKDEKGNPMAMRHLELPLYGVQFHPESIMTEFGMDIIKNWLELTARPVIFKDQI